MLNIENTVLVIVDVQGKLASLMHEKEAMMKNIITMARSCPDTGTADSLDGTDSGKTRTYHT